MLQRVNTPGLVDEEKRVAGKIGDGAAGEGILGGLLKEITNVL